MVGAGLSGLACALRLGACGVDVTLLEGSDDVGGRVRSDIVDGFVLDRGFQVLLTAYPTLPAVLDLGALDLRTYQPGALVRADGGFHRVSDPLRRPLDSLATLRAPIGSLADKLRVARLRLELSGSSSPATWTRPETTTGEALAARGFSEDMVQRFFRPFFGGVFLDGALETSSRFFEFTFRMFSAGDVAVPARGMGEIPRQMAARLPGGTLRLGSRVTRVEGRRVEIAGEAPLAPRAVVIATDGTAAARLLPGLDEPAWRGVTCHYFAAAEPPLTEAVLVLNGEGRGPVNNLVVPTNMAPEQGPDGAALVSATVLGCGGVGDVPAVRQQLADWFGSAVHGWRHLKTYEIAHALPAQPPGVLAAAPRPARRGDGLYVCGDHRWHGSIEGALSSGLAAADAVLADR